VEVKQINQLMLAMGRYGIKRLSLKKENFEVLLEREESHVMRELAVPSDLEENPLRGDFERRRAQSTVVQEQKHEETATSKGEEGVFIASPMVGTVYYAPSPKDPPFVKPGDTVEENTVVCLVEAMKVMNEVKAGVRGVVADVLVENAHPVEFGTRLFRVVT
jgi:acetyl-CoA carboxylase biotin carboxyl carrier protein